MKQSILLTFIISFLLSGCTFFRSEPEVTPTVEEKKEVEISWWGMFENKEILEPIILKYQNENPNITIDYVFLEQDEYIPEIRRVLLDGNKEFIPDIFMVHNSWVGAYEEYLYPAPNTVFTTDNFTNNFHNFVSEDFVREESILGTPLWVDVLALLYNEDILLESGSTTIPTDWVNFTLQAEKMTRENTGGQVQIAGFSGGNSTNVEFFFESLNLFFLQSLAPLTPEKQENIFDETNYSLLEESLRTYKYFSSNTWDRNFKLDSAAFLEGDLGSMLAPSWRLDNLLKLNEEMEFNRSIKVAKAPQININNLDEIHFATYWGYAVFRDSTARKESWEFLKFLTSKEQYNMYAESIKNTNRNFIPISARKDSINNQSDNEYIKPYIDSIPNAHSWKMVNGNLLKTAYSEILTQGGGRIEELERAYNDIKDSENNL